MKKIRTLSIMTLLLIFASGCSQDELATKSITEQNGKDLLQKQKIVLALTQDMNASKQGSNFVMRSIANTTWDFIIYNGALSWHADVVFHPNGTTTYDEPEYPGQYLHYGIWHQSGNVIYYDLDAADTSDAFYFTGTINRNSMIGTYTFGTGPQDWTAQKY